ncbi:hypothetical protein LPUS_10521 [Lasallia pustulata]|uniref:Uncharacterized protein n=1 Tax=Lasallia pustulata TaxID=136370 RepID=A0A1W5DA03_9LECA|nr:hypothetical protein LPUS_10521 [Lasallia pustulata]
MASVVGGMAGALQGTATGVLNQGQSLLDRFFPPERREELWAKFTQFATERPKFAAFILSQVALSGIPLALFVVMTITVFVFALVAALLIGVLGALLFTAFCVGVALLVLLPTLFITSFAGAFLFLWGLAAYYLLKWFNEKEIPGIHTPLNGDAEKGEEGPEAEAKPGNEEAMEPKGERKRVEGGQKEQKGGSKKQANGVAGKVPGVDKVEDVGKSTGLNVGGVADVKKKADLGNVTKTADVGGAAGKVPGGVLS